MAGGEMASLQQPQQELVASRQQRIITREFPLDPPPQPFGTDNTSPRHPFSEDHAEIAPNVRVAAPSYPSLGKEATSVASPRTDRSLPASGVGEDASAAGAVTAANEPPDVDPSLQARTTSIEEEPRQKGIIGKEGRMFSFFKPLLPSRPFISTMLLTPLLDAHRWCQSKDIENRTAQSQGRENHHAHRPPRTGGGPGAARDFHRGNLSFHIIPDPFSVFLVRVT
jgi:hypothetical protein